MSRPRSPIDLKLVATIAIIGLGLLAGSMGVLSASALRDRSPVTERQSLSAQVDTPATRAELGRMLFFDKRLSGDATISCATCHSPDMAWADGRPLSRGYGRNTLYFRNTPTLLNAARMELLDWDGRFAGNDLAGVVRDHLAEAHFMNIDGRLLVERMRQVPQYEKGFKELFGDDVSYGKVLTALVAFLDALASTEHPYLRYLDGDAAALPDQAKAGLELFRGKAGCSQCHGGELLTDGELHALGVPENQAVFQEPMRHMVFRRFLRGFGVSDYVAVRSDPGLFSQTLAEPDRGKFRTPSLLEAARTWPYMHNGVFETLTDVVHFYNRGGGDGPNQDPLLRPLGLSDEEIVHLVVFLESLGSEEPPIEVLKPPPYQPRTLGEN